MSNVPQGLTRRSNDRLYEAATEEELSHIVEEADKGEEQSDALIEMALPPETDEDEDEDISELDDDELDEEEDDESLEESTDDDMDEDAELDGQSVVLTPEDEAAILSGDYDADGVVDPEEEDDEEETLGESTPGAGETLLF